MPHIKWPSIESFHNVRKNIVKYPNICKGNFRVTYRGKIKLHGTNACVQITDTSDVIAQSRTSLLMDGNDNAGFAVWVRENEQRWRNIDWGLVRGLERGMRHSIEEFINLKAICFFGEWCGKGIQKGTAINNIDKKILALFSVIIVTEDEHQIFISDPFSIKALLPDVPNVYVLPFLDDDITVDFSKSAEELSDIVDTINRKVDDVERCDPWVKKTFGIDGIGEGIVYYPVSAEHVGKDSFGNLSFKAKGEQHKVVKQKSPVQVDPEMVASVDEFSDMVLTEARLEQGVVDGCGGICETQKIGLFVGWISKDVNKECQSELEASGLTWKEVSKSVSSKARTWYMRKIKTT